MPVLRQHELSVEKGGVAFQRRRYLGKSGKNPPRLRRTPEIQKYFDTVKIRGDHIDKGERLQSCIGQTERKLETRRRHPRILVETSVWIGSDRHECFHRLSETSHSRKSLPRPEGCVGMLPHSRLLQDAEGLFRLVRTNQALGQQNPYFGPFRRIEIRHSRRTLKPKIRHLPQAAFHCPPSGSRKSVHCLQTLGSRRQYQQQDDRKTSHLPKDGVEFMAGKEIIWDGCIKSPLRIQIPSPNRLDSRDRRSHFSTMTVAESKLREAMDEFNCQTGTVHRAEGQWLHLVCQAGVPDFLIEKISRIPFGKGIAGVAAETRAPVELCNLQQDLGGVAKEDARKTGVSGSLAVPVFSVDGETVIGTLGVGKTEPYDFSEAEKTRLADIGKTFVSML